MRRIAVLLAAVGAALWAGGVAQAAAGVSVNTYAAVQTDGTLQVTGGASCTGGGTATVTVAVSEGLALGTGTSGSVACDGSYQAWTAYVAPTVGSWVLYGDADTVAVLLDASDAQLAQADQIVYVY